jgi:hypothetical protein
MDASLRNHREHGGTSSTARYSRPNLGSGSLFCAGDAIDAVVITLL